MTGPIWFAELSWPQVRARVHASPKTVLLLPLGATEPHGPHDPLSTDVLISVGMCTRAAQRLLDDPELRALILPPLGYGVTRYAAAFPGVIHIEEATLRALLVDICRSLITQGLRYLMVVNNHFEPEHVRTIHESLDAVQAQTEVVVGYLDLTRRHRAQALTEEFVTLGSHAGRYETSLVLAEAPALVDAAILRSLPAVPVSLPAVIGAGVKDFVAMGLTQAYNGTPADATPDEGQRTFDQLTEMLVGQMRALVRHTGGRDSAGFFSRV